MMMMSKDDDFTEGRLSDWREGRAGSAFETFCPIRTFTWWIMMAMIMVIV